MSPPHHISCSPLLPNTRLQVNTSAKPSEAYQYYRPPCHYLAIYRIFYSYLLQVYRSTRRQNLRSIPVLQVTMSPPRHISYFLLLPTTGLQVNTSSKSSEAYQYYRSPCPHLTISHSLLLPTTGLQVNMSSKHSESIHYYRSPCHHLAISHPLLLPTTGPQLNSNIEIYIFAWRTFP